MANPRRSRAESRPAARPPLVRRFLSSTFGKIILGVTTAVSLLTFGTFVYFYLHYARLIDEKLAAGPFPNTSMIFSAPRAVSVGDETSAEEIAAQLRQSGYTESRNNRMGYFHLRDNAIDVFPGPESYFDQEAGVIKIAEGKVEQIVSLRDNTDRNRYELEPELITHLFDRKREKRRTVRFGDMPKTLVNAVISIEDKRFFQHAGFDPLRVLKSAYVDVVKGRHAEGASTLSMQLARTLWLNLEKTWKRKAAEVLITLHLEQKLTKKEIFEYYANHVDLGRHGSFSIRGFGEAAQAYFGKDLPQLTLAESATLAGLIQRPSFTNPVRWPERAKARRNICLSLMLDNGYITQAQYAEAAAEPLVISRTGADSSNAPYFVDIVNDELQDRFQEHDFQTNSYRVYTTLDMDLQRDAAEAVRIGMQEVDQELARRRLKRKAEAQVALVALDPYTGEVRALVGGRDYGVSQLNRALAKRQPGSAFKPFVYAAALNTAIQERQQTFTPVSLLIDEPTTFWYDNKPYEPNNYKSEFHGQVTVRQAIAKSLNIPTVKLAEATGYEEVVRLARAAGMNLDIQPTPAVALGAYEVTPIEVAGAYTAFANKGIFTKPNWVKMIRDDKGALVYTHKPAHSQVLDPRVAYLMVDLLREVMATGTAAGTRARGFTLPAAGKTGTSHDGWFAGFTTRLLCAVWVGFDDNSELRLEGARSALPVWTEFMKRAHQRREYRGVRPFDVPDGIVTVSIDPASGHLATPACPLSRTEVFVTGTQPLELCPLHGGGRRLQVAGWETAEEPAQPGAPRVIARARKPPVGAVEARPQANQEKPKEERKGFFSRIRDLFK